MNLSRRPSGLFVVTDSKPAPIPQTLLGFPVVESDEVPPVGDISFELPTREWAEQVMHEFAKHRKEFPPVDIDAEGNDIDSEGNPC